MVLPSLQSATEKTHQSRVEKLSVILSGEATIQQHLQFLISNNHSDLLILRHTKESVRASVCHTATVIANGFMHCGTTSDQVCTLDTILYFITTNRLVFIGKLILHTTLKYEAFLNLQYLCNKY